ncbi:phosphodiester glycosidase family protein [Demequina oxidasica]|uniref:phosphodiester glycosidase family protein n=1 Tax=Demequina oxidasica TaxID=676199 RepID=UPI000782D364|nr:phosphodiester glycosidase family protein [Demequina oxidasica]
MTTPHAPPAQHPVRAGARRRRIRRIVVGAVLTLLVILGSATLWALNRYVFEHVEVSDVSSYEASLAGVDEATTASPADPSPTPQTETSAGVNTSDTDAPDIDITEYTFGTGTDQANYFVADVTFSDIDQLRSAFAQDSFGLNITEDPSDIAADVGAQFAVNGDYYGFRDTGIEIRNGVAYRDDGARTGAVIYDDGTMDIYDETATTADELVANGAWQTLSFGPALVDDGEIVEGIDQVEIDTNFGNHSIQGDQPRTAIGMVADNHYVFVVVDGRSSSSVGVTLPELAQIMKDLGATEAYNLDGGGSSAMVSDGGLVNDPLGKGRERGVSDILWVG